jgi:hypothetical protein
MVAGCWLMVTGYWLLVNSRWSLEIGECLGNRCTTDHAGLFSTMPEGNLLASNENDVTGEFTSNSLIENLVLPVVGVYRIETRSWSNQSAGGLYAGHRVRFAIAWFRAALGQHILRDVGGSHPRLFGPVRGL